MSYCRWYEKNMKDLTEQQQEKCEKKGRLCIYDDGRTCQDLIAQPDIEEEEEN